MPLARRLSWPPCGMWSTGTPKRLFSFRLDSGGPGGAGRRVSEAYLLTQLERGFRTLDFYKQMTLPAGPDR